MKSSPFKLGFIFAVIGVFIFGYREVGSTDWELYSKTDLGDYYYDAESVTHPFKDTVTVWAKKAYTEKGLIQIVARLGPKYRNLEHTMYLYELDCVDRKLYLLRRTSYSKDGSVLSSSRSFETPEWSDIPPDTVNNTLYKIMCK